VDNRSATPIVEVPVMVLLAGLGTFLDGYDPLNISVVLPFLSKFMHLSPAMRGPP